MIKKARNSVVQSSRDILGGEPVFWGTRVPIKTLIDYLKSGESLDVFLKDFPTVQKEQIFQLLDKTQRVLAKG